MHLDFDPPKDAANIRDRGLPFSLVTAFEFETAVIWQDTRKAYPEVRFSALGLIGGRVYSLVFTEMPKGIRVISLRKANPREVKRHEQETQS
ncbi:MAG: BrnT family toxin [Burkholderiales bacterium]